MLCQRHLVWALGRSARGGRAICVVLLRVRIFLISRRHHVVSNAVKTLCGSELLLELELALLFLIFMVKLLTLSTDGLWLQILLRVGEEHTLRFFRMIRGNSSVFVETVLGRAQSSTAVSSVGMLEHSIFRGRQRDA